jgi:hypothetical protein
VSDNLLHERVTLRPLVNTLILPTSVVNKNQGDKMGSIAKRFCAATFVVVSWSAAVAAEPEKITMQEFMVPADE